MIHAHGAPLVSGNPPLGIAYLVVLVGPPGSGKSTWAKQNGPGAIHVSQDDLIDAISPDGFEHVYRPIYTAAENAIAHAAIERGQTVIVDRTNRTRAHRKRWLTIAREAACPAVAVVMSTSVLLCLERNRRRNEARRLSEERMARMLAALEPVRPDEGFALIVNNSASLLEILARLLTMNPPVACVGAEFVAAETPHTRQPVGG